VFDIDRFLKTKHLDYTFVLYSTCQTIKDNLIGSVLYFYKNVTFGICFQLLWFPKQIYKTLTFSLKVFDIDRFLKTKHLDYTFVL